MTAVGAMVSSVGMAIYGGPFRAAGWATGVIALTAAVAVREPRWAPLWGFAALLVAIGVAGAAILVKTAEPVLLGPLLASRS